MLKMKLGAPILALFIAASILVSPVFAAEEEKTGIMDIVSNIINQITDWLKSSPISTFIPGTTTETKSITLSLFPDTFSISPDSPVLIKVSNMTFEKFKGEINASFSEKKIVLKDSKTDLKITIPLTHMNVTGVEIDRLVASDMRIDIKPNMTADNSSVELNKFSGSLEINPDHLEFNGEVSLLKARIGGLEWELK